MIKLFLGWVQISNSWSKDGTRLRLHLCSCLERDMEALKVPEVHRMQGYKQKRSQHPMLLSRLSSIPTKYVEIRNLAELNHFFCFILVPVLRGFVSTWGSICMGNSGKVT